MNTFKSIKYLAGYTKCQPILEGFSTDQKYFIEKDGQCYLLRTFKAKEFSRKKNEFSILQKMLDLNVKCSVPIEIGKSEDGKLGYMILSYFKGLDASKTLPLLNPEIQYRLGLEAGAKLKKMHQCFADPDVEPWYQRKLRKHTKYLEQFLSSGVQLEGHGALVKFINDNLHLMKNRPNGFQHDDYHVGNLIVSDTKLVGVIDFNRYDWGDPIHDFLKIGMFSSEVSGPFSVGQIHGYFKGQDPGDDFWVLYSLYLAMAIFSSFVWTKKACPNEMPNMMKTLNRILNDHDWFKEVRPKWYLVHGNS